MNEKHIPACIDQMTSQQAKIELGYGRFGEPGSPSHNFASFWISIKEGEERGERDSEAIRLARRANLIAWIASIMAMIAIIKDIIL